MGVRWYCTRLSAWPDDLCSLYQVRSRCSFALFSIVGFRMLHLSLAKFGILFMCLPVCVIIYFILIISISESGSCRKGSGYGWYFAMLIWWVDHSFAMFYFVARCGLKLFWRVLKALAIDHAGRRNQTTAWSDKDSSTARLQPPLRMEVILANRGINISLVVIINPLSWQLGMGFLSWQFGRMCSVPGNIENIWKQTSRQHPRAYWQRLPFQSMFTTQASRFNLNLTTLRACVTCVVY